MLKSCGLLWLVLSSIFFSLAATAQEKQGLFRLDAGDLARDTLDKEGMIVSASRSLKEVGDIPMTVYIIERREILENGYITLVDVLKSVPGIKVSQPGSAVEGETFLVRGLHGNYFCKILIDGVPVQPSVVSGMPISAQLPIRQAERIEVTFGPSASIYGADALGGVINIVTHTSDRPVTAQADVALGKDSQEYLNVSIGGKAGKNKNVLTYSLFGNAMSRKDMRIKEDVAGVYNPYLYDSSYSYLSAPYYQGDSTTPVLDKMPDASSLLGFSLKWRGLSFQFLSMSRKTHSSIGLATNIYSYANPENFWAESIQRYTLNYEFSRKKIAWSNTLSYLFYRLDNQSSFGVVKGVGNSPGAYKYAASDDIFLDEQLTYIPIPGLELTGGLNVTVSGNLPRTNDLDRPFFISDYHSFSTDPINDTILGNFGYHPVTYLNAAGYLQVYYRKGRLIAMAADRYDYHSRYKGSNNPKVALQYKITEKLSVRTDFGTGFRTPSPYFAYASLAYVEEDGIYYQTVPNEALKPEKLLSAEAGIQWEAGEKVTIDGSFYYHLLRNQFTRSFVLLDTFLYPDATNFALLSQSFVNDDTSRAELFGFQFSLRAEDLVEAVRLSGELQLSLSKGMESLPGVLGRIDSYRQWPAVLGQVNISLRPAKIFYLYFRNVFSSRWTKAYFPVSKEVLDLVGYDTETKGYYTLDIVGRLSINRNFQAFFQLNNVFNSKYGGIDAYGAEADLVYNPQYGRNFKVGLSFTLE